MSAVKQEELHEDMYTEVDKHYEIEVIYIKQEELDESMGVEENVHCEEDMKVKGTEFSYGDIEVKEEFGREIRWKSEELSKEDDAAIQMNNTMCKSEICNYIDQPPSLVQEDHLNRIQTISAGYAIDTKCERSTSNVVVNEVGTVAASYSEQGFIDLRAHVIGDSGDSRDQPTVYKYEEANSSPLIATDRDNKLFQCSLCDYSTARKKMFQLHMNYHKDKKQFQCTICEYKTSRKKDLEIHMYKHKGNKPFQCNICDYKTARKSHFVRHMYIHMDKKPFQCTLCEYNTCSKKELEIHMYNHTGNKPFQCNICDYSTAKKYSLDRHMYTH